MADAFQTVEDYTDDHGLLQWEVDDPATEVDAVKFIHPFERARDAITSSKKYKHDPGERFRPRQWSRRKDENGEYMYQTYSEWVKSQVEKG